jgi:hypothetical protein
MVSPGNGERLRLPRTPFPAHAGSGVAPELVPVSSAEDPRYSTRQVAGFILGKAEGITALRWFPERNRNIAWHPETSCITCDLSPNQPTA